MIRRSPIRRTRSKPRPGRLSALAYAVLREAVLERDGYACRHCGRRDTFPPVAPHHLQFRSQGGPDTAANLASLCGTCHDLVHARKLWTVGDADNLKFTNENPRGI